MTSTLSDPERAVIPYYYYYYYRYYSTMAPAWWCRSSWAWA
ncbi:MAG: hypothetical protein ACRDNS_23100 [Trebonia sp.]